MTSNSSPHLLERFFHEGLGGGWLVTAEEWRDGQYAALLLQSLRSLKADRKFRLYAVACVRQVQARWGLYLDAAPAVEMAERVADKLVSREEEEAFWWRRRTFDISRTLARVPARAAAKEAQNHCYHAACDHTGIVATQTEMPAIQANLLRCIFGNPYQPATFDPQCRTSLVIALAQDIYDERILPSGELDPQRLGILADALEEARVAGVYLEHLRDPGPHTRGCFVVDAILGKT